jgi:hypothetical protein
MKFDCRSFINDAGGHEAVAELCGVHISTVYRWIGADAMPSSAIASVKRRINLNLNNYCLSDEQATKARSAVSILKQIKKLVGE